MTKITSSGENSHDTVMPFKNTFTKIYQMGVIVLLLLASISVAAIFLVAFIWSVRSGQFDDEFSPPVRILFDDKPSEDSTINSNQ
jgi:cbb3-type cytochrome oxidase maturation protein